MLVSIKGLDHRRAMAILDFLGPLDTLIQPTENHFLKADIDEGYIRLYNTPTSSEITHSLFYGHSKTDVTYQSLIYSYAIMLWEHRAILANKGKRSVPLQAIHAGELLFRVFEHYGIDATKAIKQIRKRQNFSYLRNQDDYLELPNGDRMQILVDNDGLMMTLKGLRYDELEINRKGNFYLIEAEMPESFRQAAIGKQLREFISHPLLDPLDLEIKDIHKDGLLFEDRHTNGFRETVSPDENPDIKQAVTAWEATWDSGHDLAYHLKRRGL